MAENKVAHPSGTRLDEVSGRESCDDYSDLMQALKGIYFFFLPQGLSTGGVYSPIYPKRYGSVSHRTASSQTLPVYFM